MLMTTEAEGIGTQTVEGSGDRSGKPWRKAKLPNLSGTASAEDALAAIVLSCVEHLRGNEACVLSRSHKEGIHQMRVAVRRLRSCIALFRPLIPEEQFGYLDGELKWLIGELGPARDWDVFVADVMGPVIAQMADEDRLRLLAGHVEQQRDRAYATAQAAVGSQRYLGLVLLFASWAEGRGWHDVGAERNPAWNDSAAALAQDRLQSTYDQLLQAGDGFEQLDPEARHKVRIQLKKLRYASEFFSSLYPRRRVTPYLSAMKALQDDLGTSNDRDVAKRLLKRALRATRGKLRAKLAYAAGLVVGWHSHVGNSFEQELVRDWHRFVARRPYWQPASDAEGPPAASQAKPSTAEVGQAGTMAGGGDGASGSGNGSAPPDRRRRAIARPDRSRPARTS